MLRPRSYGRRRAVVLGLVHLLFVAHFVHWKLAGRTLAPLELNEVMHTLELGIVTAGFLFMAVTCISVLAFGRFFCSWGCHILALEDLCALLLRKIGVRPRPVRSRLLVWVAPVAMAYMFLWPQAKRLAVRAWPGAADVLGRPADFDLRVVRDGEGWASFLTEDFARNLPGPGIAALTFLVCGFLIVYVLGSRSFCTYGCPYGVVFGFVDRFAPGRIRLRGDCTKCARCTAACDSHVSVHEEVALFGRVVDPRCLKDLDCVSVCPTRGLTFGLGRPAGFLSWRRAGRRRIRYSLSRAEEGIVLVAFLVTLLVYRGLYFSVPFLLTLALGAVAAWSAVTGARLLRRPSVRFANAQLKRDGRLTGRGGAFLLLSLAGLAFTGHSGWIRYHEARGVRAFTDVREARARGEAPPPAVVDRAIGWLTVCDRQGLHRSLELSRMLADLQVWSGAPGAALPHLQRVVESDPGDDARRFDLARCLAAAGRAEAAMGQFELLIGRSPGAPPVGSREARRVSMLHYNVGVLSAVVGRRDAAMASYRAALALAPDDAQLHNNLGHLLMQEGRPHGARRHFERASAIDPELPEPLLNLGRLRLDAGDREGARRLFAQAVRLAPGCREAVEALLERR